MIHITLPAAEAALQTAVNLTDSGDGAISLDEFTKLVQSPKLKCLGCRADAGLGRAAVEPRK